MLFLKFAPMFTTEARVKAASFSLCMHRTKKNLCVMTVECAVRNPLPTTEIAHARYLWSSEGPLLEKE